MADEAKTELDHIIDIAYKAGRRDALHSIYAVIQGRPDVLRPEIVTMLRDAYLDAEHKLRKDLGPNDISRVIQ